MSENSTPPGFNRPDDGESREPQKPLTEAEMDSLYDSPRANAMRNVGVGAVAILVALLIFWAAPRLLRVDSDKHFLVNMPLCGLGSLEPFLGADASPSEEGIENQTVLVVLWTPWSTDSCRLLRALAPSLQSAGRNANFRVVSVVYSSESPKAITEEGVTQEQFNTSLQSKAPLLRHVRQTFTANGFHFGQVWWDPVDAFRSGLMDMALTVNPSLKTHIDGIGFPTLLFVQGGVIRYVWAGYNEKNLEEIRMQLELVRAMNTP